MKTRTCDREGCSQPGKFIPRLLVFPTDRPDFKDPAVCDFPNTRVCGLHRDSDPGSFVTDEMWDQIEAAFKKRGLLIPDRHGAQVQYLPASPQGGPPWLN